MWPGRWGICPGSREGIYASGVLSMSGQQTRCAERRRGGEVEGWTVVHLRSGVSARGDFPASNAGAAVCSPNELIVHRDYLVYSGR